MLPLPHMPLDVAVGKQIAVPPDRTSLRRDAVIGEILVGEMDGNSVAKQSGRTGDEKPQRKRRPQPDL